MNRIKSISILLRTLAILIVMLIAGLPRWKAGNTLAIDFDENNYIHAGQLYTSLIRTGERAGFLNTNYRTEHPPLAKIAYGISFLSVPEEPLIEDEPLNTTTPPPESLPENLKHAGRTTAVLLGTIEAGLLAAMNPLAGLLLAIHGFTIKYRSEIMLGSLASMLSVAAALFYYKSKKASGRAQIIWLLLSVIGLGLAADTKYQRTLLEQMLLGNTGESN